MITRSIASVALACAFGLTLGARHALAQDARLQKRLDPQTAAAVAALVDSAGALGLPAEPLVQKALEGQSKGASGNAIVGAVRALIRDLATARDALGDDVDVDALRLAAAALAAGATPAQLERLRPHRSREAFAGGLAGLVYLMSRGVPAEKSLDLIAAMLDARLSAAEFASLQRLVERDMMAGAPAAEAATVRAQALIRHGRPAGPGGGVRP
ncbi:MAG TPA: hypothetical protein VIL18_07835 [Longimicrobiales bacterium]